ncbi:metallophosphoesterase [Sphingobium cupriresistens]|uniref:Serine/threonine protein phosphatase n=1 Tax=Sphingobium cupriresistens LL01 TaxID=1420583 RepID=A0A0J8AUN0_9SPHN|nr:metallophosphoesterase [Sphingobium cupriresistens]KMS57945.1 serine/threonine protein phosphatase [Sphingobium cupriresistens LL01]
MSNAYVIADLHGRFDLLCRAIDLIEADAGEHGGRFIVLGDFVDRGPQSRNIIDLLMAGPQRPNWQWTVLQGNHEAMMLECLGNPGILRWWIGNGGGQTLQSYGYQHGDDMYPLRIPFEHLDWLASLPVVVEDDYRIYVHAGVPYDQPVAEAKPETMQWMLYEGYDPQGDAAELMPDAWHVSGKHIVHGHEQSASHPLCKSHRTNLDSFAWSTGRAAIGVFDDDARGGPVRIMDAIGKPFDQRDFGGRG